MWPKEERKQLRDHYEARVWHFDLESINLFNTGWNYIASIGACQIYGIFYFQPTESHSFRSHPKYFLTAIK